MSDEFNAPASVSGQRANSEGSSPSLTESGGTLENPQVAREAQDSTDGNIPSLTEPVPRIDQSVRQPTEQVTAFSQAQYEDQDGGLYRSESEDVSAEDLNFDTDNNGIVDGISSTYTSPISTEGTPASIAWTSDGDAVRARSAAWRGRMTIMSLIVGLVIFLITRDWISSGTVVLAGLLFGILGSRKPQAIHYQIDFHGITIDRKLYSFSDFRAFSVSNEGLSLRIALIPLKRFMPVLSLHFEQSKREQIIHMLSSHLPVEDYKQDMLDYIVNKVKI